LPLSSRWDGEFITGSNGMAKDMHKMKKEGGGIGEIDNY